MYCGLSDLSSQTTVCCTATLEWYQPNEPRLMYALQTPNLNLPNLLEEGMEAQPARTVVVDDSGSMHRWLRLVATFFTPMDFR